MAGFKVMGVVLQDGSGEYYALKPLGPRRPASRVADALPLQDVSLATLTLVPNNIGCGG